MLKICLNREEDGALCQCHVLHIFLSAMTIYGSQLSLLSILAVFKLQSNLQTDTTFNYNKIVLFIFFCIFNVIVDDIKSQINKKKSPPWDTLGATKISYISAIILYDYYF